MKVEYVEETSVRKALAFEIEAETVAQEIEARAREYARKVKIPGFRPGKIPPSVVKQRLHGEILGDVAETIVNRVVFQEIEGRGLKPLAAPKVTELKIDENQPMTFRAVFETLPLVEVPDYKGLAGQGPPSRGEGRKTSRRRSTGCGRRTPASTPSKAGPSQRGDFVVVDLAWRPQGGGKGGRDENALIEVGGEGNHEDMNEALEGHVRGRDEGGRPHLPRRLPGPERGRPDRALRGRPEGDQGEGRPRQGRRVRQGPRLRRPRRAARGHRASGCSPPTSARPTAS